MTTGEPELIATLRTVTATRPTFAAAVLLALHERDRLIEAQRRELTALRRRVTILTIYDRILKHHFCLPVPRPPLTPELIDTIVARVLADLTPQGD